LKANAQLVRLQKTLSKLQPSVYLGKLSLLRWGSGRERKWKVEGERNGKGKEKRNER